MDKKNLLATSRLYVGEQHALFVGVTAASKHKHHAMQISVALRDPFRIRIDGEGWQEHTALIIFPDVEHELDSGGLEVANLLLDVESSDYQLILQAEFGEQIGGLNSLEVPGELLQKLRLFHNGATAIDAAPEICTLIMEAFLGRRIHHKKIDSRISQVLEIIGNEPAEKIRVGRLADAVALSSSRLAHLFAEQVGIPIRRYRIWKAIREAVRLCLAGASLTEAAQSTGFTDSAHFSNTFRDLFGMNPSQLLSRRATVEILLGKSIQLHLA